MPFGSNRELLTEAVGSQDQISAAYSGFDRINFERDGSFEVKQVILPAERLSALQQHCAMFFTGFSRTASEIAKEQIKMTPHRQRALNLMRQMLDEAEAIRKNLLCVPFRFATRGSHVLVHEPTDEVYDASLVASRSEDTRNHPGPMPTSSDRDLAARHATAQRHYLATLVILTPARLLSE
jgi:D-glycero-alpha-D-manno-heptose-7-phosphate kinase